MKRKLNVRPLLDFILRDWRYDFITIKAAITFVNFLVDWLSDKFD